MRISSSRTYGDGDTGVAEDADDESASGACNLGILEISTSRVAESEGGDWLMLVEFTSGITKGQHNYFHDT